MNGVVSFGRAMLRSNRLIRPRVTRGFLSVAIAAFADFGPVSRSEAGENNGREREEGGPGRGHGPDAELRRLPQESPRTRGSRRDQARKNPNRERLGFRYWWWDDTPHQTTIESTESKRCGLLRTSANTIEKPAGTPFGGGRSNWFFALIGGRKDCSTSSAFRSRFNSETGIEPASVRSLPSTPATGRRSASVPA